MSTVTSRRIEIRPGLESQYTDVLTPQVLSALDVLAPFDGDRKAVTVLDVVVPPSSAPAASEQAASVTSSRAPPPVAPSEGPPLLLWVVVAGVIVLGGGYLVVRFLADL